jgi:putative ABC transport system permease protein
MLGYHLFIAYKSLRRTPGNTLIIVAGIALGVAVATLFSAIRHTFARDPIPGKSGALHHVRMDSWDPHKPYPGPGGTPPLITQQDMVGIMKSDIPIRQAGSYGIGANVRPQTDRGRTTRTWVLRCHADFFAMFDVPFRYGSAWNRSAGSEAEPVVVLGEELNNRWFGGEDSVGRLVTIDGRDFRVVGVLSRWRPAIRFYDLTVSEALMRLPEQLFIPIDLAIETFPPLWSMGWKEGESIFINMWVELKGPAEVAAYRSFLDAYALDQRRNGRFLRPLDNRVTPLLDYMKERGCTPPVVTAMTIAADLFLCACALSLMGLLLARFLARSAEIGVRRALGARRWDVFAQHVLECELLGIAGGLLGLALASASVGLVNGWFKTWVKRDDVFRMDSTMAAFAAAASLAAGLLAGVYPAYRVCRTPPASHLKIQ